MKKDEKKIVCQNRRAYHNYTIVTKYEAGISLFGSEVKSLRDGRVHLTDAYVEARNNELYLVGVHIGEYPQAGMFNHQPKRDRKLLMHKGEINRIEAKVHEKGFTIIPLSIYFREGKAKVEIAFAYGKAKYDKREAIKKRDQDREMRQQK